MHLLQDQVVKGLRDLSQPSAHVSRSPLAGKKDTVSHSLLRVWRSTELKTWMYVTSTYTQGVNRTECLGFTGERTPCSTLGFFVSRPKVGKAKFRTSISVSA